MPLVTPSHLLLVAVAAIWGFAFVAQSAGMETLGPHSFNAARFLLGALSLLPLWLLLRREGTRNGRTLLLGGLAAGTIMFGGFSFQQIGLLHTTAGNAGFITGMYIVFVPLTGVLLGHSTNLQTWSGVILALLGLYSLSVGPDLSVGYGDFLELIGALFWTAHVILINWLSRRVDAIELSILQFVVATVWASIAALALESPTLPALQSAWLPLVYAGVASSGVAFTLQIIAQRKVEPGVTALLLSGEAVFAVLGGWLLLDEQFGSKELLGCSLMLAGMLVTQWPARRKQPLPSQS
ncbi:transporter [Marinobacterium zhoushanense]|uniref:Transporter n=1 Tax=Marinobacterium zhoushanense TaxID=1679163 RepID=A0ABQ1K161_9GAMM|nr:DMT family transporter [Marinobacterium zhoushanense]GGB80808.1 transporter [Marinobacterium zhoushanense]